MGKMNTKSIYKITNRVNGKVYIGQSNNCNRRFHEHIKGSNSTSLIHLAIKKYGVQNFDLDIIEKDIENYDEQEKFWIKYYRANQREFGYNILDGGQNPPILLGENNALAKISNKDFYDIEQLIQENILTFADIAKKYNLTEGYISKINRGLVRRNKNLKYPLRKSNNYSLDEDKINLIIHDLMYTHLPTEHIAKKHKIDSLTIFRINKGDKYKYNNISYPIREDYSKISNWMLDYIIKDIKENKLKFSEIENKYKLSKSTISRINQGKIWRKEGENYPLRNSKQRVH